MSNQRKRNNRGQASAKKTRAKKSAPKRSTARSTSAGRTPAKRQSRKQTPARTVSRSREELRRDRREKQAKKKRRKNRARKIILVLVLVIVALIVVAAVFFKIDTIKVEGVSQYTDSEIISASGVNKGDNIFLVRGSSVQEKINAALPYSGKVTISRTLPHTLVLHVSDAEITTAIQEGTAYYLLDEDGVVLERARDQQDMIRYLQEKNSRAPIDRKSQTAKSSTTTTGTGPVSTTTTTTTTTTTSTTDPSGQNLTEEQRDILNHVMIVSGLKIKSAEVGKQIQMKDDSGWKLYQNVTGTMRSVGLRGITELDLTSPVSIKMMYMNRIYVSVGDTEQLERKLELCKKVLEGQDNISKQQTGELDVSIPGKAFFYPGKIRKKTAGQKTTASSSTTVTTRRAGVAATAVPSTRAYTRQTTRAAATGYNNQRMTSRSW